jgi:nucleotidyltransferase/DNA polymerase involved in DNA repair
MSVLSCYIPEFLLGVAGRQGQTNAERPLALTGEDGRVVVASEPARTCGVNGGMTMHQALKRCPDLAARELDLRACETEHAALLSTLARTGLPVEAPDWGSAYVDLREVARDLPDAQSLCADLGRQVRHAMGDALQPALGWDTGKFTARAAAVSSRPGQMRLVEASDERRFLFPLPIALLPLPPATLQQLDWLGIRTVGGFARLPAAAVQQRFGPPGKLAQQLAQGHDARPVRPTVNARPEPIDVDFDSPTTSQEAVLNAALHTLRPRLGELSAGLEGCRRLHAELHFIDGGKRLIDHAFVQPSCQETVIRAALAREFERLTWPGELTALQVMLLDVGELVPAQLSLFPELDEAPARRAPFVDLAAKLTPRYGAIFWRAKVTDERHPLPERRFSFSSISNPNDSLVAR